MSQRAGRSTTVTDTPAESSIVRITYDLFDLPTAQHKAGLAGLLLQIRSMEQRTRDLPLPRVIPDNEFPQSRVTIEFTEETTQALFDDLYDATLDEGAPREKPFTKGKGSSKQVVEPLRRQPFTVTDKKGNEKSIDGYVYRELAPSLATLTQLLPAEGGWVRLWRDLIWQIIREGKKKAPYIKRAAKKKELQAAASTADSADADSDSEESGDDSETSRGDGSTWADLLKFKRQGADAHGKLSGALLLGAMEKNAESLILQGRIDQNLLLHFWPLSVMVFVPQFVDSDGETHIGRRSKKDSDPQYCIVVPEVSDLVEFVESFPRMLELLSTDKAAFRPRESLIDLPAQAAFAFIEYLALLARGKHSDSGVRWAMSSVDYFHVTKAGNNVKFVTTGRVVPRRSLVEDYQGICGRPGEKPPFSNPLFRRGLMMALLDDVPWYQPFAKVFQEWRVEFFIQSEKSPAKLSWFWSDARKKLQLETKEMSDELDPDTPPDDKLLAALIHRVVRTHLLQRAIAKSGIDPADQKKGGSIDWENVDPRFSEAKRKAGESLFLELRSRRDQAFIDHFTQTLFAGKQFLSEANYSTVGLALLHQTENVKTLTLMALSANS